MILAPGRKVAIAIPVDQTAYATYRMLTANPPLTTGESCPSCQHEPDAPVAIIGQRPQSGRPVTSKPRFMHQSASVRGESLARRRMVAPVVGARLEAWNKPRWESTVRLRRLRLAAQRSPSCVN